MQRPGKWVLTLALVNLEGPEDYRMSIGADEFIKFGDRHVEELRYPMPGVGPAFNQVVETLRLRDVRRDLLKSSAKNLGAQMASYMEDEEGWHGTDRQDRIRKEAAT